MAPAELFEDEPSGAMSRHRRRVDPEVGILRRLVRQVDSGEPPEPTPARFGGEPLRVPLLGDRQRRVDVDLDKFLSLEQLDGLRGTE
jgi:hypothetical protein